MDVPIEIKTLKKSVDFANSIMGMHPDIAYFIILHTTKNALKEEKKSKNLVKFIEENLNKLDKLKLEIPNLNEDEAKINVYRF